MKVVRIGTALSLVVAMLAMASGATATTPQPVTITVVTGIGGFEAPFEVAQGPICGAGTVSNVGGRFIAWQSGSHARIIETKRFGCPDGTFDVLLRVTLDFATGDTVGTWSVLAGSGAYASLHGAGSITGDKTVPDATEILDTYIGGMHLD
jgi:hypothetical protein